MRVLINVPDLDRPGGVSALFNILKMDKHYPGIFNFCLHGKYGRIIRVPLKYIEFTKKLRSVEIVHLNPSLDPKSFFRDAVFAWITIHFSRKLIVYWHGWRDEFEKKIKGSIILRLIIKHTFLKADASIVLGTVFKQKLRSLGFTKPVYIETNAADNTHLVKPVNNGFSTDNPVRLLFLSRLETEKGVYIAIDTLRILNRKESRFRLIIAGKGSQESRIKEIIKDDETIEWAGYVNEEKKHRVLATSHIMILPSYSEGLPLTILEGMMYGLPIISRPVGGIADIVTDKKNGYLIESLSPEENAGKIMQLAGNSELFGMISRNNIEKSKLFSPEVVRKRLKRIYEKTYSD